LNAVRGKADGTAAMARVRSQDTVAKPLDDGALSLAGNTHAGEGHRGGGTLFLPAAMGAASVGVPHG
jgi:hypothetical protein